MLPIISFFGIAIAAYSLLRLFKIAGKTEFVLFFFLFFSFLVVISGYVLSYFNHIADLGYWAAISIAFSIFSVGIYTFSTKNIRALLPQVRSSKIKDEFAGYKNWFVFDLNRFEKILISTLLSFVLLLGVLNLIVVIFTAPNNWDSMAVHLARMAYYIQNNNLSYFSANHWAQVTHPKIQPILFIFTYLISGKRENLTQSVQYLSYWISIVSIYGISLRAGNNRKQSLFAALVSGLLVESLMEATTTQNDMILAAFVGITTYALITFKKTQSKKYLFFAAIGIGISIGIKEASIIPLISIGVIALFALISTNMKDLFRNFLVFGVFLFISLSIIALPSGYLEIYQKFGGAYASGFTFYGQPIQFAVKNGTKNLLRFGFQFFSLDGLPGIQSVGIIEKQMRAPFINLVDQNMGIELETPIASALPFSYSQGPIAHEDRSFWGILGFGLVWLGVLIVIIKPNISLWIKVLGFSALLFVVLQAYFGYYDPFRGRYFISSAIFAVPTIGFLIAGRKKPAQIYILIMVIIGCISALTAIVFREDKSLISINFEDIHTTSIFSYDRIAQLNLNNRTYLGPYSVFEKIVPKNSVVATFLQPDSYEYPLFGERLSRTIIPINSFAEGMQPIPEKAQYLLYILEGFPCPLPDDTNLGSGFYLRKLNDTNRNCP